MRTLSRRTGRKFSKKKCKNAQLEGGELQRILMERKLIKCITMGWKNKKKKKNLKQQTRIVKFTRRQGKGDSF